MTTAPFAITGMDLSGYMVKDAKRAIAYYRDVLGLEPSLLYPGERGAEYQLADGSNFGLWGAAGNGILFAVDDIATAVAALEARGAHVLMQRETPVCFMAMINDSEGNTVTLRQRKSR
jgi:predicted enzyme related to lactoylglutathione lyase